MADMPDGWMLGASSFNWTHDVIRARRSAQDIVVGIAEDVVDVIELEAGQVWRSFPEPSDSDVDALRDALSAVGGRVSVVGMSLDDFRSETERRTQEERLAFLLPQLKAARRVGAVGVRLPLGQAGRPLLERLRPVLHELDLILFEEIQGQQSVQDPAVETIAQLDDARIRLVVDTSMFMPALPPTYLKRLRSGGIPGTLVDRLSEDWRDPQTHDAVLELLQSGEVPEQIHTLYMNLLIRFGRSEVEELRDVVGLIGGFHLKFWDLDDTSSRISEPLRDLGRLLARSGFEGTLVSEWGGHEWLQDWDPMTTTRSHLALARTALTHGAHVL
jgi:hypothetical protein